jgi:hypothetical protein
MIHGTSQCGEIQGMKYDRGRTPVEPATIVSDAAEGWWASENRDQGNKGPRKQRILMRDQALRGIIAYCEEAAGVLTANVSRGPNDPFRDARQLVAHNADTDGEAIELDLHF